MTFWERVRAYANKRVREQHMQKCRHERKCPRCNTWTSEVDGCKSLETFGQSELMTCKKCGYTSKWFMNHGPLPVLDQ